MKTGIDQIAAERARQILEEGWTPLHDMTTSNTRLPKATHSDDDELNEMLCEPGQMEIPAHALQICGGFSPALNASDDGDSARKDIPRGFVQWTTSDEINYFPAGHTAAGLNPGVYEIEVHPQMGIYFKRLEVRTDNLLRFPQTNCEAIVNEIQNFWEKEALFAEYQLTYKRGILMWGPPGSGKTSTIGLLTKDIIERDGIVLKFNNPFVFADGFRVLRQIEPTKPVVVLMEDIDSLLGAFPETAVLNILDGVESVSKVVFLASTNYPKELGARIVNRPSRFDKRFKIGHPNPQSRGIYFDHLLGGRAASHFEREKWVADTEGFSLAHLKELFVAVVILGDDYDDAIKTLSGMKAPIPADNDAGVFGLRAR